MMISKKDIELAAEKNGIDMVGITSAKDFRDFKVSDSEFVKYKGDDRIYPSLHLENAKSVVVIAQSYNVDFKPKKTGDDYLLSKSSYGKDYHKVMMGKINELMINLKEEQDFNYRAFCDTGPLVDRLLALRAGIGFLGKNTAIINKKYGSFIFIAYAITSLEINCSDEIIKSECKDCDLCIRSCPNRAIKEGYMDYKLCLSYISQKKGELNDFEKKNMKYYIYGCDICQNVCPFNKTAIKVSHEEFMPVKTEGLVKRKDFSLGNSGFKAIYGDMSAMWRGKNILRRNADIIDENNKDKG